MPKIKKVVATVWYNKKNMHDLRRVFPDAEFCYVDFFDKEKLEKDGVIAGYHAMVDPMKLGYHILAFINLDVIPEDKPKFYAYAESVPNVLECSCVTGEYSMLMKVAFQTTMELDIFIGQLQKFGKTSTQIVFSTHVGPRGVDVDEV